MIIIKTCINLEKVYATISSFIAFSLHTTVPGSMLHTKATTNHTIGKDPAFMVFTV